MEKRSSYKEPKLKFYDLFKTALKVEYDYNMSP